MIVSVNPATGETLARFEEHDANAIEQRLAQAQRGQQAWASTPLSDRLPLLRRVAQQLRTDKRKAWRAR